MIFTKNLCRGGSSYIVGLGILTLCCLTKEAMPAHSTPTYSEAYFNGSSFITLSQPLSLYSISGVSFRSCVGGELFNQRYESYTLQVTALLDQIVATFVTPERGRREFRIKTHPLDNRWHFVALNYDVTTSSNSHLVLRVDNKYTVIANTTFNWDLLLDSPLESERAVLVVGNLFSGCMKEGPQIEFHSPKTVKNVKFGPCPLTTQQCKDRKDVLTIPPKDHCYHEPCIMHGTCISKIDRYECICSARYTGNNCEIDLGSPCNSTVNPCQNGATCVEDSRGDYTCICPNKYHGIHCEQEMSLHPSCLNNPCQNGGSCNVPSGTDQYICTCLPGFTGINCESNIDECNVAGGNPCNNGGICIDAINNYTCNCKGTGYSGSHCEININECEQMKSICGDGICYDLYGSYVCACPFGRTGNNCEIDVSPCAYNECENGGTCKVDGKDHWWCECPTGWGGVRCSQPTLCTRLTCPVKSYCLEPPHLGATVKYAQCVCEPGYYGASGLDPNCTTLSNVCATRPCKNGGTCLVYQDNFNCTCLPGYTGLYCETMVAKAGAMTNEECENPPCPRYLSCKDFQCLNGGRCMNTPNGPMCQCPSQYSGTRCEKLSTLVSIDACLSRPCLHGGTCQVTGNKMTDFICTCRVGYEGSMCERVISDCRMSGCKDESEVCNETRNGYKCESKNAVPCPASIPCVNGTCQGEDKSSLKCVCDPGFTGDKCHMDIDECSLTANLCNQGVCINNPGSYACFCTPGYTGDNCSIDVDECLSRPCKNNGTCDNLVNNYFCHCKPGFRGTDCSINIDECESNPCSAGSTCVDGIGTFSCVCQEGLTGPTCAVDIDDCESSPCLHGGECKDALNSFTCDCDGTGYTGDECQLNIDECAPQPCRNNATCVDALNDYECRCYAGYTGKNCEQDVAECESNPCLFDGICLERSNTSLYYPNIDAMEDPIQVGYHPTMLLPKFFYNEFSYENASGFECVCVPGITGPHCEHNINECESNPCGVWGKCVDGVNMYKCECEPGFEGDHCQLDIDECERYKPCAHGTCRDRRASYYCSCEEGWGGRNCSVELRGCQGSPCLNKGVCHPWLHNETEHRFNCSCRSGFHGTTCQEGHGYAEVNTTRDEGYDIQFRFKTTLGNGLLAIGRGITFYILELANGRLNLHTSLLNKWEGVFIGSNLNDSNWQKVFVTINSSHVVLAANEEQTIYPINQNEATNASSTSFPTTYLGGTVPNFSRLTHGPSYFVGCFQDVTINSEWLLPDQWANKEVENEGIRVGRLHGVTASCPRTPQCEPNPCRSGGSCEDRWSSFRCTCPRPYLGVTCQYNYTAATFGHEDATSRSVVSVDVFDTARRAVRSALDISMFIRTRQSTGQIFYLGSKPKFGSNEETSVAASLENGEMLIHLRFNQTPEDYTVGGTRLDNGYLHLIQVVRNSTLVQVKLNGTEYFRKSISAAKQLDAQVLYLGGPPPPPVESNPVTTISTATLELTVPPEQYFKGVIQDVQVSNGTLTMVVEFFPLQVIGIPLAFGRIQVDESSILRGEVSDDSCASNPCNHNGTCTVTWNDYRCTCTLGYKGKSCDEVEFCQLKQCPENTVCRNLDGGYECLANATFNGLNTTLVYKLEVDDASETLPEIDSLTINYRSKTGGTLLHAQHSEGNVYTMFSLSVIRDQITVQWRFAGDTLPHVKSFKKDQPNFEWTTLYFVIQNNHIKGDFMEWQKDETPALSQEIDSKAWQKLMTLGTIHIGAVPDKHAFSEMTSQNMTDITASSLQSVSGLYTMDTTISPITARNMLDAFTEAPYIKYENIENSNGAYFKGCLGGVHIGPYILSFIGDAGLSPYSAHYKLLDRHIPPVLTCTLCLHEQCTNGGHCHAPDRYDCVCPPGFVGDDCETNVDECANSKCMNGATCVDGIANYTCICSEGWEGWHCSDDIDECASGPCAHGGHCVEGDAGHGYTCVCTAAWTGPRCLQSRHSSCADRPCVHGHCTDVSPSIYRDEYSNNFTCTCNPGYVEPLCDTPFCLQLPCLNGGTCHTDLEVPKCECPRGWRGDRCDAEEDACISVIGPAGSTKESSCLHGGRCISRRTHFVCDCANTGFTGPYCQMDIDECSESDPKCGSGECYNLNGTYTCNCSEGFCGHGCSLVDPCFNNTTDNLANSALMHDSADPLNVSRAIRQVSGPCQNGGRCEQMCTAVVDYMCHCIDGWGGKNCSEEVLSSAVNGDSNGSMMSNSSLWIGVVCGVIGAVLVAVIVGVLATRARRKRATRGAYSPSSQEYANPRMEALAQALKPPPEERLI